MSQYYVTPLDGSPVEIWQARNPSEGFPNDRLVGSIVITKEKVTVLTLEGVTLDGNSLAYYIKRHRNDYETLPLNSSRDEPGSVPNDSNNSSKEGSVSKGSEGGGGESESGGSPRPFGGTNPINRHW